MKAKRTLRIICLLTLFTLLGPTFLSPTPRRSTSLPFHFPSQAQEPLEPLKGFIEYRGDQRILNLWGSHYEMGYAHGYLLASEIVEMIEKYVIEERYGNDPSLYNYDLSWVGDHFLFDPGTYGAELQRLFDGMVDNGADLYLEVMDRDVELLDLKLLNCLAAYGEEGEADEWDEGDKIEIKGTIQILPWIPEYTGPWIVDGHQFVADADTEIQGTPAVGLQAKVDAFVPGEEEWPLATKIKIKKEDGVEAEIEEEEGCSSFSAWDGATSGGGTLAARNLDWRYDKREGIVATYGLLITYDPSNPEENDFVAVAWPGVIGAPTSFNQHGVFLSHNYGNGRRQYTGSDYIPANLITRKAIETADDEDPVGDVLSVVLSSRRSGSAILLVAYPSSSGQDGAQVIEYDAYGAEVRGSDYDFPDYEHIIATNHFVKRYTPYQPWPGSVTRYNIIANDLLNYYDTDDRAVDSSEAEQILRDALGSTLHSVIAHPDERSYDVYFAKVIGYDPVQFAPAPYAPSALWWSNWVKPQNYQWSDLFPGGSNHGGVSSYATLTHGPVVGAVISSSATILARTSSAAYVKIKYCTKWDVPGKCGESVSQPTTMDTDYTTQILLDGLSPSTTYYYDVLVDGSPQLSEPYPQFKTFPPVGTSVPFTVVVLNDFNTTYMDTPEVDTFTNASNENPDLVIIGGDFDHRNPRSESEKRQMFKALYSGENNYQEFVDGILRKYPVAHVWDDHDYGEENADKTYVYKDLSLKVLREYFPLYPNPTSDYGDWQKFTYGQAEFFMLDSRSQRDPNAQLDGPDKSMLDGDNLGSAGQLEWLKNGLLDSTATWKIIYTPSVFNPTSGKDDSWASFQYERQHLLDFISSNEIAGVILIAGDMHFGAIDDGTNSGLPEMEVPSPNVLFSLTWDDTGTWSEGIYYEGHEIPCLGYGVLTFHTDPEDQVLLEVKNDQGQTRVSYTVVAGPPPTPDTVHVSGIDMSLGRKGPYRWAEADVVIVDQEGDPVSEALVTGEWSGLTSGTSSGTTGTDGMVTLVSSWTRQHGTFTFTVAGVTAPGYIYDPSADVSDSISW